MPLRGAAHLEVKMNKKNIFVLIIMLTLIFTYIQAFADGEKLPVPELNAQSAIMMDLKTGKIVYSKNPDAKMFPASTTKILTAIIALEKCDDLSVVVTASHEAISPITREDSNMGIYIGEQLTLEQLINGMLVDSANDAANVIAIHVAGSLEAFAQMMNEKAQSLGAVNSHFVNPHGFHNDDHYATASDLAVIARYAMGNEKFREIVKKPRYTMPPTNKYKEERILPTTNHLISKYRSSAYFYAPAIGIKTGFTSQAGNCLVAAAQKDGTEFLSVVMKCTNTGTNQGSFTDTRALFEYGFSNFKYTDIAAPGEIISDSPVYEAKDNTRVAISVRDNISSLLPVDIDIKNDVVQDIKLDEKIKAPLKKGDAVGNVSFSYNGDVIGETALVASNDVERDNIIWFLHTLVAIVTNPFVIGAAVLAAGLSVYFKLRGPSNRRRRTRYTRKYK